MARGEGPGSRRTLVELKTVADTYPLYGALETSPPLPRTALFDRRGGLWGAAVAPEFLNLVDLSVGDVIRVGEARFEIRAVIDHEPDRIGGSGLFTLGPRVMIANAALAETALEQPGSLIRYTYRIALPEGTAIPDAVTRLTEDFPEAGWRVRTLDESSPRLTRLIGRVTLFLSFVGLTALLVGGVGVANAVRAWLDGRTATIATLKCLGAPRALVFRVYLLQVLALAGLGIATGLAAGALLPMGLTGILSRLVPIRLETGFSSNLWPSPRCSAC